MEFNALNHTDPRSPVDNEDSADHEPAEASTASSIRSHPSTKAKSTQRQKLLKVIRDEEASKRVRHLASLLVQGSAVTAAYLLTHDKEWLSRILQVPERALRFGLRALNDHVSTGENLFRWGIDVPQYCPHCKWRETTKHVLSDCTATLDKALATQ